MRDLFCHVGYPTPQSQTFDIGMVSEICRFAGALGWASLLLLWTLEIVKCKKGEDQVLEASVASIIPRESVESILSAIAPKKQASQTVDLPTPAWNRTKNCI